MADSATEDVVSAEISAEKAAPEMELREAGDVVSSSREMDGPEKASTSRVKHEEEDNLMCRVCRGDEGDLYYPCLCTGSIKYVHQECLMEWLKYSKKEVCELCNHKYSFQPIYRADMPKKLPVSEILRGVAMQIQLFLRTWLVYTMVIFAWLGLVPLTAARIFAAIFAGSLHALVMLPFTIFNADNIMPDIAKGCLILSVFVCIFISLLWLREQDEEEPANEEPVEEANAEQAVEEARLRVERRRERQREARDRRRRERERDEAEANNQLALANAGGPGNNNNNNNNNEEWGNNWDRLGDELTWQRLLGLDGSLVFIEHVFWVISLSTLFTIIFAFSPYKFGNFVLVSFGLSSHFFPTMSAVLTGYLMATFVVYLAHEFAAALRMKVLHRWLGVMYLVLKVFILVLVEIGLFPIMCGCWLDLCSLKLFSSAYSSRIAAFASAPSASVFLHWMIGMVYVFYSASFVILLREILRPGVLWFMRNLNDPDFNPIQEMIDQPVQRHLKRLCASMVLFFLAIMLVVFVPLQIIDQWIPGVLPYNMSLTAETPLSELSVELLILQVVLPALLEQTQARTLMKAAVRKWCEVIGAALELDNYLLVQDVDEHGNPVNNNNNNNNNNHDQNNAAAHPGQEGPMAEDIPVVPEEAGIDGLEGELGGAMGRLPLGQAQPQAQQPQAGVAAVVAPPVGGGLAAEHQALLLVRDNQHPLPYIRPPFFGVRVTALICAVAATAVLVALACFTLPVSLGRLVIKYASGHGNVHELYTCATGFYLLWMVARGLMMVTEWFPQGMRRVGLAILEVATVALKVTVVAIPLVLVIPMLFGLAFQLVVLAPIRVTYAQTPLLFPWQDWAMGILHTKIAGAIVMMGPDWWMKTAFDQIYNNGVMGIRVRYIYAQVVLPILMFMGLLISWPYVAARFWIGLLTLTGLGRDDRAVVVRLAYPCMLAGIAFVAFLMWQYERLLGLAEKIRNEKYLVGTQLVNYERAPAKTNELNAVAPVITPAEDDVAVEAPLPPQAMDDVILEHVDNDDEDNRIPHDEQLLIDVLADGQ